jgi:hypothetical protein
MRMQIKQIIMSITAMIRALELDEELVSMLTFAAFKTLGEAVGTPTEVVEELVVGKEVVGEYVWPATVGDTVARGHTGPDVHGSPSALQKAATQTETRPFASRRRKELG